MQSVTRATLIIGLVFLAALRTSASPTQDRVTILYDAFGKPSGMKKDWGYSALVEYGGKRILFDTGNNAEIFAQNVKVSGVDLKKLDFAVISHRHGDHTGGMNYLLTVNPQVKIFAPKEGFGVFGASMPGTFYRQDASLPDYMRYYNGKPPQTMTFGTPWPSANFVLIDGVMEAAPGVSVIATVSQTPGTLELRELSLAIETPKGLVLVVGCSHPGIERIVEASMVLDKHVYAIVGGLHLVTTPESEIARIVTALHDKWKVDRVALGHCTGEPAFAAFQRAFGSQYNYAGLGSVIELP
ncbi:MAG TPA: MBL fold metallo-hydrolase [Candidatus Udaeobacter sp.]|nr:MBL fold metallo-hydrolase [Candidatus Udaeobacter sp.]